MCMDRNLLRYRHNKIIHKQCTYFKCLFPSSLSRGTCQGSVLGGLFYSLYSNNLSSRLSCHMLSYADDVILYAKGSDSDEVLNYLIEQLEMLCKWCDENGIKLNYSKTKYMIFHKEHDKTGLSDNMSFIIRNEVVERVFDFKYLGIFKRFETIYKRACAQDND